MSRQSADRVRRQRTQRALIAGLAAVCVTAGLAARPHDGSHSQARATARGLTVPAAGAPNVGSTPSLTTPPKGLHRATISQHLTFAARRGTCAGTVFVTAAKRVVTIACSDLPAGRIGVWGRTTGGHYRFLGYPIRDADASLRTVLDLSPQHGRVKLLMTQEPRSREARPASSFANATVTP